MKDRIKTIIRDWLNETFGNPQALPGPLLDGLAEEIDKHRWEIHKYTQEEYDMEDIEYVAEDADVELTAEEKSIALHRYQNVEDDRMDHCRDIVEYIVDYERRRKKSDDSEKREKA